MGTLDNGSCFFDGEKRSKAAMSNKQKEAGGLTTDFTKFPDAEIRKVRQVLLKS